MTGLIHDEQAFFARTIVPVDEMADGPVQLDLRIIFMVDSQLGHFDLELELFFEQFSEVADLCKILSANPGKLTLSFASRSQV